MIDGWGKDWAAQLNCAGTAHSGQELPLHGLGILAGSQNEARLVPAIYNSLIFFARHLFFLLLLPRCSSLLPVRPAALSCHPHPVGPTLITVDLDVHSVSLPIRPTVQVPICFLATCNAISTPGAHPPTINF